ncbi:MAG: GntR family transcriptional regulator [Planctomycetota bacterium]|jgi:DNA-binding LacI/PurR family transcriptional regulator
MNAAVKYTDNKQTLYDQVADKIRNDICCGNIAIGERLLPESKLAEAFDVSLITMQRALRILTEEELIERTRRSGTFVSEKAISAVKCKNISLVMFGMGDELALNPKQSPTHYQISAGIQKFCHENSWNLQIIYNRDPVFFWKQIEQANTSGIILVFPKKTDYELIAELKKRQLPYVCINLYSDEVNTDTNFINLDYYSGTIDAVHSLYKKDRRSIALVNSVKPEKHFHNCQVIDAYKEAVKMLGMEENIIDFNADQSDGTIAADYFRRNFEQLKEFDTFIVTLPRTAFLLYEVLKERGVKIPEKVFLLTLGESQDIEQAGITTYSTDVISLGYESVCALNEIFESKNKILLQKKVKLNLVERCSAF